MPSFWIERVEAHGAWKRVFVIRVARTLNNYILLSAAESILGTMIGTAVKTARPKAGGSQFQELKDAMREAGEDSDFTLVRASDVLKYAGMFLQLFHPSATATI